ncbi:hypothetical protein [Psychrobacter sp. JB385]|uniref:hypothetical protein n=1 Tax=Psychrobacter sp. JB385 TaxID=1434841 RepID=UPI00097E80EA|nr:hypothetical protein [Psychrobacter sp. JB385]SJN42535.1 hypothetical protein CZ794_12130 [Psychrobacter sp. JB385]
MSDLNKDWTPTFGTVYTWFAMDKKGRIAVMVNNCWGDLPQSVLNIPDAELLLDDLNEYMWEESKIFNKYPTNKKGKTILDLYSSLVFRHLRTKQEVANWVVERSDYSLDSREENLPSKKGYFVYLAIEGSNQGEDYPVGYNGATKMGDYYRYLVPTIYASIEDFPQALWHGIAVSDTLDFTKNKVLDNDKINTYFPRNYQITN